MNTELTMLGKNIRKARLVLNLSQEGLGQKCGLHRTYICDMERGARNVSFITLLRVSKGLEMTLGKLIENLELPGLPDNASPGKITTNAVGNLLVGSTSKFRSSDSRRAA